MVSIGIPAAYAGHGSSGGGGGCAGSCIPPTLGVNSDNELRVTGGLSINYMPFDVEFYTQNIPTQTLSKGEQAVVIVKIFDSEGPTTLEHVELHFSPYDEFSSGTFVEKSLATLVWDGKDGDEVIGVHDDKNILQNISIDAKDERNLKIISFKFEPVTDFEKMSLMTVVWDKDKNSAKNYFIDAIKTSDSTSAGFFYDKNEQNTVPTWIKTSAGWWADDKISDDDFLGGIEFMIQTKVLSFQMTDSNSDESKTGEIPT